MGKHRNKSPRKSKIQAGATAMPAIAPVRKAASGYSRRSVLRIARNVAIATVAVSASGWAVASQIDDHCQFHDLTVIGNGIPTVVQIHDPQCPTCRRLRQEAIEAGRHFAASELQVRVANIRTDEGRRLADRHGVPHVTLLLFDGDGQVRRVIQGLNDSGYLRVAFEAHVAHSNRPRGAGTRQNGN